MTVIHSGVSHTWRSTKHGLVYATVMRCPDFREGELVAADWSKVEITCPLCRAATPDDPPFFVVRLNGCVLPSIARAL